MSFIGFMLYVRTEDVLRPGGLFLVLLIEDQNVISSHCLKRFKCLYMMLVYFLLRFFFYLVTTLVVQVLSLVTEIAHDIYMSLLCTEISRITAHGPLKWSIGKSGMGAYASPKFWGAAM